MAELPPGTLVPCLYCIPALSWNINRVDFMAVSFVESDSFEGGPQFSVVSSSYHPQRWVSWLGVL